MRVLMAMVVRVVVGHRAKVAVPITVCGPRSSDPSTSGRERRFRQWAADRTGIS
jgi:hypothetical protein